MFFNAFVSDCKLRTHHLVRALFNDLEDLPFSKWHSDKNENDQNHIFKNYYEFRDLQ